MRHADDDHFPVEAGLPDELGAFCVLSVPLVFPSTRLKDHGRDAPRTFIKECRQVPVLFLRAGNDVFAPTEVIEWSISQLRSGFVEVTKAVRSIGLLHQYGVRVFGEISGQDDFELLLWNFLAFRLQVEPLVQAEAEALPAWTRVSLATAEADFRAIREFGIYCAKGGKNLPWLGFGFGKAGMFNRRDRRILRSRETLLDHLKPFRDTFVELVDDREQFPAQLAKSVPGSSSLKPELLTRDWVTRLIEHEKNITYRALWLLLAFGGCRLSEGLNLWATDIRSGYESTAFGCYDMTGMPFVVLAHPSRSRFIDSPTINVRTAQTRTQYLLDKYGLVPRNLLPEGAKRRAGYKGVHPANGKLDLAWIYWIDKAKAAEFEALATALRRFRQLPGVAERSPYLFVNTTNTRHFGYPTRLAAAEKAFRRASDRIGGLKSGRVPTPHWLRYFYKNTAESELKLGPQHIQLMMHHSSIESQEDYTKISSSIREAMQGRYG